MTTPDPRGYPKASPMVRLQNCAATKPAPHWSFDPTKVIRQAKKPAAPVDPMAALAALAALVAAQSR